MASDFMSEAKRCLNIICSRISPFSSVPDVPSLQDWMIACILKNIPINVCHYIVHEQKEYFYQDIPTLIFPVLITELCKRADVEKQLEDHWIQPEKPYHSLKVNSEGGC